LTFLTFKEKLKKFKEKLKEDLSISPILITLFLKTKTLQLPSNP
jgi:hypothetical protein